MPINISILALIIVVILNFVVGYIWYSTQVFGKAWMKEVGLSTKEIGDGPSPVGLSIVAVSSVITVIAMSVVFSYVKPTTIMDSVLWGLLIGVGFISTAFASNYVFEKRSRTLFLLDAGYWILSSVTVAIVVFLVK